MDETKTVSSGIDLYVKQIEDVADMRSSLLSFNRNDPNSARKAIQNITILRVYHQLSRIVRYTEAMDKLEDKMYQAMDSALDNMDVDDPLTWRTLVTMQSKLQENMIQSHKLLEPYLNFEALSFVDARGEETQNTTYSVLSQDSREKLRNSAQEVLRALEKQSVKEDIQLPAVFLNKPNIISKQSMKEGLHG